MPVGASFFEDVPLVKFMLLVFICMPSGVVVGDSGICFVSLVCRALSFHWETMQTLENRLDFFALHTRLAAAFWTF